MGRRKRCHEVLISNLATARERKGTRVHGAGGQVAIDSGLQTRNKNVQVSSPNTSLISATDLDALYRYHSLVPGLSIVQQTIRCICIPHLFQVCRFVDSTRERCLRFKLGLGMRLECQEQMQRSGNSLHPIFFQRRLRLNVVSQSRCLDSDARLYPFHDNHYDRLICPFPSPLHSGMLSAWLKTSVSHLVTSREVG